MAWLGAVAARASSTAAQPVPHSSLTGLAGKHEVKYMARRTNGIGLSLMSSLYAANRHSSVFISPLSIVNALGMVALGATPDGAAQSELLNAWQLSQEEDVFSFLADLRLQLAEFSAASEKVEMQIANSVWCKASINDAFVQAAGEKFGAVAKTLPRGPGPINEWCSKATQGMIPTILDEIPPLTVAVLVNAVFFKGAWADAFKRSFRGEFHTAQKSRPCAMMRREDEKMLYAEGGGLQVVELPYGSADGRLAAVVVLPEKKDNGSISELMGSLGTADGIVALLEVMGGLQETFEGTGQFLRMSDDPKVHLSAVFHKAKVEVNERGTKAAAATAGVMETRSIMLPPPDQRRVIADHPFLFFIRDRPTGTLLFAGAVVDPELDTSGV